MYCQAPALLFGWAVCIKPVSSTQSVLLNSGVLAYILYVAFDHSGASGQASIPPTIRQLISSLNLSLISSFNTEFRSSAAKGRLTETLISRCLPVNNRPLNILLIIKCEVCEATKERTNTGIGRVSLCVFHQTVSRDICLLASRNDDTICY